MKRVTWKCPLCGSGKLASSRPKRRDVVRYCLACSEETGELVSRIAPALDRKRTAKKTARSNKAKRKTARKREKIEAVKAAHADEAARVHAVAKTGFGIDLEAEYMRLRRAARKSRREIYEVDIQAKLDPGHRYRSVKAAVEDVTLASALKTLVRRTANRESCTDRDGQVRAGISYSSWGGTWEDIAQELSTRVYGVSWHADWSEWECAADRVLIERTTV